MPPDPIESPGVGDQLPLSRQRLGQRDRRHVNTHACQMGYEMHHPLLKTGGIGFARHRQEAQRLGVGMGICLGLNHDAGRIPALAGACLQGAGET